MNTLTTPLMSYSSNSIVAKNNKSNIRAYNKNTMNNTNRGNVSFGSIPEELKFVGGFLCGIAALVGGATAISSASGNKNNQKQVQYYVYNNMTSKDSENGMEITDNEQIAFEDAMNFYQDNAENPKWSFKDPDDKLVTFVKNATLPDSNGGITITEEEKEAYNFAKEKGIEIKKQLTTEEKEANKGKGKSSTVVMPIPVPVPIHQ